MTSQDPDPTVSTPITPGYQPAGAPPPPPPPTAPPVASPGGWTSPGSPPPPPMASSAAAFPLPTTSSPPPGAYASPTTPMPPTAPPPIAEPAWRPPPADSGRTAGFVFGVILVLVGLWFFATTTLGLDLPRVDWGALWPLLLIGVGAWIVIGALGRRH